MEGFLYVQLINEWKNVNFSMRKCLKEYNIEYIFLIQQKGTYGENESSDDLII